MDHLISRKASEIKAEPISWLVPDVFPEKALSILFGLPMGGKSHISLDLAAAVSNGSKWAEAGRAKSGNVIVMNVDEDPARIIKPRLRAAGANLERVHVVEGVQGEKGKEVFNLAKHFDALKRKVEEVKRVRLCIIDPIYPNAAGRAGDTVNALRNFAEEYDTAVLAVMHPKKGDEGPKIHKIAGSQTWGAAARSVWCVDGGALFPIKLSWARADKAFKFGIGSHTIKEQRTIMKTSRVCFWSAVPYEMDGPHNTQRPKGEAEAFLIELLKAGPVPAVDALAACKNANHAVRTIARAKKALGIGSVQKDGKWSWALPRKAA